MGTATQRTLYQWSTMLAASALMAVAALWSAMGNARADERVWTIKEVAGVARIQRNGEGWRTLKVGDAIRPGNRAETAADGRLVLVRPGDSIAVAANSRFEVPAGGGGAKGVRPHIVQTMGTLLFRITTRPERPFGVKTPYLAAVIKGTTFTVSVDGPRSALHVSHGAVEVTSVLTGQVAMVRPGMTAAIDGGRGGALQVIGGRRSDAGGGQDRASGKGAAKATAAGTAAGQSGGSSVIARTVGAARVDVFASSRGLVRDLTKGPGAGPSGRGPKGGATAGTLASTGDGLSGPHGNGRGPDGASIAVRGLGAPGRGIGNGGGPGNGNGPGNGGGPGNGNGAGNGKGHGKPK